MRKVLLYWSSQSELPLIEPIIDKAKQRVGVNLVVQRLKPALTMSAISTLVADQIRYKNPDIVLCVFDRREQVAVASTAFYTGVVIFHFGAGSVGYGHVDDIGRHIISTFAHIICAESPEAKERLIQAGEEEWRIKVTGMTHFDNVDMSTILNSGRPIDEDYDLMLFNPISAIEEDVRDEINYAISFLDKKTVILPPNEDANRHLVLSALEQYADLNPGKLVFIGERMAHRQFLKTLRHCKRFISNSSSAVYEAPMFAEQGVEIVNPSMRNSQRTPISAHNLKGGSEKLVELLRTVDLKDPNLRKKKLRFYNGKAS